MLDISKVVLILILKVMSWLLEVSAGNLPYMLALNIA